MLIMELTSTVVIERRISCDEFVEDLGLFPCYNHLIVRPCCMIVLHIFERYLTVLRYADFLHRTSDVL